VDAGRAARAALVDPRIERSRELVLAATLELLGEIGYGNLTIEAVAARSGVAKSTIYRHWPGKLALITDAFTEMKQGNYVPPPPGPVRERVEAFLTTLAHDIKHPDWRAACMPALIDASARDPDVAQLSRQLAESSVGRLVALLDEALAAGELPAGTDTLLLADALTGPIVIRALFHRPLVDPADVPAIVDSLLPR
jgi:TetR/AcrR family transcriptional regulator, regulator of autoinduction and epiphytic fitness